MSDHPTTTGDKVLEAVEAVDAGERIELRTAIAFDRATEAEPASRPIEDAVFEVDNVSIRYSGVPAVADVTLRVPRGEITALIGPSGCGKSTLLRSLNRMNDLIDGCTVDGSISYNGEDVYGDGVDPAEVRRRIGMVFQKPNPFAMTIYDNVAFGPRLHRTVPGSELDGVVEQALRQAALWEEVKDKLNAPGPSLSGGQQQRLCIARAVALQPDVILMDEPCSALDPIATLAIEDLMRGLRGQYSIVIVTHNMQQAARVSDRTAFLTVDMDSGRRVGQLVEYDLTEKMFTAASDPRTEAYITGRFG